MTQPAETTALLHEDDEKHPRKKAATVLSSSIRSENSPPPPPPPGGRKKSFKFPRNHQRDATLTASVRKRRRAEHLGSLDFENVINTYSIQAKQDLYGIIEEIDQADSEDDDDHSQTVLDRRHYQVLPRKTPFFDSRGTTRWALTVLCSLLSGLTTVMIVSSTEKLVDWRTNIMDSLLQQSSDNPQTSELRIFLWYALISVLLADAAALLCVFWAPEAVGSGIPEVIGYLNGIRVKKFNRKRMLIVKMVGSVLSVGSSLAVGMEGPLICIGAIMGAALAQVGSLLSWILTSFFHKYESPLLTRLWIWATSDLSYFANDAERRSLITIGAACGFAASFGAPIGGLLFILDDIASFFEQGMFLRVLVANALGTFCLALYRGDLSSYGAIQFGTYDTTNDSIFVDRFVEIPFWILQGIGMGIMSGYFCKWFDKVKRWSGRIFNTPTLHLARITYVALITSAVMFYLPTMKWVCHDSGDYEEDVEHGRRFFCAEGQINEMATIMFGSRGEAIVRILSNPGQFYPLTLVIVGFVFFLLMLYTNTTFIPSGLFTPIVLSGASFGGAVGILLKKYVDEAINPSTFALLGVAAMMAGIQRSTVSTCVILVEGTGQIRVLLPIMIVVVIANYFAYLVHEDGVYDVLMNIKGYPYLEPSETKRSLDIFHVGEIMSAPVITVQEKERAIRLVKLLRNCRHNGFPVVDKQGRFKGLVRRKQIVALIECGIFEKLSPSDDISLNSSRGSELYSPKPGIGRFQGLMYWAFHIKDDRYGNVDDLPQAEAPVEDLDDDEFGDNQFLLNIQKTLRDVPPAPGAIKPGSRTSFLNSRTMKNLNNSSKRISLGGDDAMPRMNAGNFRVDPTSSKEDVDREQRGSLITPENHHSCNDSVITTGTADSAMKLTNSVQSAPTGFARVGKDSVEDNVVISWLHPAHHNDVVNLADVMNQATFCIPEHFPVSQAYQLFTKLGLRWIVVIGGESGGEVMGILTRATLLNSHIYNQTGVDMSKFQ
jgi:chloride channel 7